MEKIGYVARKQQKTRYDEGTGGTVSRGGSGSRVVKVVVVVIIIVVTLIVVVDL